MISLPFPHLLHSSSNPVLLLLLFLCTLTGTRSCDVAEFKWHLLASERVFHSKIPSIRRRRLIWRCYREQSALDGQNKHNLIETSAGSAVQSVLPHQMLFHLDRSDFNAQIGDIFGERSRKKETANTETSSQLIEMEKEESLEFSCGPSFWLDINVDPYCDCIFNVV